MEQKDLVPTLKSILYDSNTFVRFISEQGKFFNLDSDIYIKALNDYMSLILLFNASGIDKNVFDRINSINIKYNHNKYYNYSTYITQNEHSLSASFIEQILTDENLLTMFLDFDNHPDIFWNIPLEGCLSQIISYLKNATKRNLIPNQNMLQHFKQIINKYSFFFKQPEELKGTLPVGEIDPNLESSILTAIDFSKSKFSIALQLYTELCRHLIYDATFLAYRQNLNNRSLQNIYQKKIQDINLQQNNVTCNQFSHIYAKLLIKCGFEAKIRGSIHKYVNFKCDGNIIEADSSKQSMGKEGFYLSDFTNCKLNLPVTGFTYKNSKRNIENNLNKAYQELGLSTPTFTLERIELLNKNVENLSFEEQINILDEKSKNSRLKTIDYVGYLVALIKTIFPPKKLRELGLYTAYIKDGNDYQMSILLAKDNLETKTQYFLFHSYFGCIKPTEEQIKKLLENEMIIINRQDERIQKLLKNSQLEENSFRNRII